MKRLLFATVLCLVSCTESKDKKRLVTFEMQKITGEWITATYSLPENSTYFLHTSRGSYSLFYNPNRKCFLCDNLHREIRAGIIDYKVIK